MTITCSPRLMLVIAILGTGVWTANALDGMPGAGYVAVGSLSLVTFWLGELVGRIQSEGNR